MVAVGAYAAMHRPAREEGPDGQAGETGSSTGNMAGSVDTPMGKGSHLSSKSDRRADAHLRRLEANNRAACIMNIRNVQQAMRSHQNMNGFSPGGQGFRNAELIGPDSFIESRPTCPSGGTYEWAEGTFPPVGELALRCSHPGHVPVTHEDW